MSFSQNQLVLDVVHQGTVPPAEQSQRKEQEQEQELVSFLYW